MENKIENKVYVICYENNILDNKIYQKILKEIGDDNLYNYKFPKKAYFNIKDVKKGTEFLNILPPDIRNKITLVEFIPNKIVNLI